MTPLVDQRAAQLRPHPDLLRPGLWRVLGCFVLTVSAMLAVNLAGADEPALTRYRYTQTHMGMPFEFVLYAPQESVANLAVQATSERIEDLNHKLSDYDPTSELSKLSDSAGSGRAVPVSEDLFTVLAAAQELAKNSDGAFDVTVGPYVKLWRRARREKEMPSPERLAEARDAVGYQYLKLDPKHRTALLERPKMRLDLGGIGAGYAIDEAMKVLKAHGIRQALVDASGDILVSDPPPGKPAWQITIASPGPGVPAQTVSLTNGSITTSGDLFQFVELGGKRYSHIVNPHTGLGLTDHSTVAVTARDGITADSVTKVVSVLGPGPGLKFIENLPGAAAWVVHNEQGQPVMYQSKRFAQYLAKESK